MNRKIAIIGGGITGLAAAWEVQQHDPDIDITILEKTGRWGGKIITHHIPGPDGGEFISDAGPESFVTRKPEAWDLALELGLADQVVDPGAETRAMFVLDGGKAVEIPLSPLKFLRSRLLSGRGKLRMLAEPFIPSRPGDNDESLAAFVTRRLGREALDRMLGPVLAGIYNTDPETQSLLATSPVMREMELDGGSLVRGALRRMQRDRREKKTRRSTNPTPRFITFKHGAGELVRALVDRLDADLRLESPVRHIRETPAGYALILEHEVLEAEAVICALPANAAGLLLAGTAPQAAARMAAIRHVSIGTVALAFRAADVALDPPINGLMVPRREARRIDAVTWTSNKMPARAPEGYALLRVFFGGADPAMVELEDADLLAAVLSELKAVLGLQARPLSWRIERWPGQFPQADVGHLERVAEIEHHLPPGLFAAGSSYHGVGVPDCIRQGRTAGEQAVRYLKNLPGFETASDPPAAANPHPSNTAAISHCSGPTSAEDAAFTNHTIDTLEIT